MEQNTTQANKATVDRLNWLHQQLCEAHIQTIMSGESTAADKKAAAEFLDKQGISGVSTPGSNLDKLRLIVSDVSRDDVQKRVGYGT